MKATLALAVALALVGDAAAASAAPTPATLLARYQPVLVLHPAELFRPVAVDGFLADAALEQRTPAGWAAVEPSPAALPTADPPGCTSTGSNPCWRLDNRLCTARDGVASLPCYRQTEAARGARSVLYGAVFRREGRIALQYWSFYSYDFWSGVLPPTDLVWQAHEGDWEAVTVLLTQAGRPLLAGYSQHGCGKRRAWSKVPRWRRTHPLVYVAFGAHAGYFAGRPQPMDLRKECYPPLGAAILRGLLPAVLDFMGEGARYGPARTRIVRVTATSPKWMAFPGVWSEENLFHAPEPFGTVVAAPTPRGPRFHELWREPVKTVLGWRRG